MAHITVRYWASAKAAAGTAEDSVEVDGPIALSDLLDRVTALHPGTRLPEVLKVCSTLLGDRPVGTADPDTVLVGPGESVEFLPPYAGG